MYCFKVVVFQYVILTYGFTIVFQCIVSMVCQYLVSMSFFNVELKHRLTVLR